MLERVRTLISEALAQREGAEAAVKAVIDAVEAEGRSDLTADETTKFDAARAELRSASKAPPGTDHTARTP